MLRQVIQHGEIITVQFVQSIVIWRFFSSHLWWNTSSSRRYISMTSLKQFGLQNHRSVFDDWINWLVAQAVNCLLAMFIAEFSNRYGHDGPAGRKRHETNDDSSVDCQQTANIQNSFK